MDERQFAFASFRLDPAGQELWDGEVRIPLRPKVYAALRHLLEHAGRLVTRDELREAVWPATAVSESVLRGVIRELRDVLGDDAAAARFIETVPHRGHRFIAAVTVTRADGNGEPATVPGDGAPIGRGGELARLHGLLARARQGARQVVFVTGEPGIGKSTLVDAFLAALPDDAALATVRGQCVEHYGAGEAYLPVLEALAQLCRGPGGGAVAAVLGRHAPTWLAQMPALIADADLETVQRRAQGATRERMLRELAEALETLTAERTVVLALEDLHWSDYSTLDLLSLLAQRRAPARLLVIGTYRPADVAVSGHPLKGLTQELRSHGRCDELPLPLLSEAEVGAYLAAHLPRPATAALARAIHRRTEGNPLFVVTVVEDWLSHGASAAPLADTSPAALPESLRQLIEKQLGRLTADECELLEVASVAGAEFSSAVVASALGTSAEAIDAACEALARRDQFLRARAADTLADGSVSGRYAFRHALYQQALYEQVAPARRVRLHRRIAEWEEHGPGGPVKERAAQLARHFEQGQDPARAITYLEQAADTAMQRRGPHEAVALLQRSLNLLRLQPDSPDRAQQELALLVTLGVPLLMTRGYAAEEVERTYAQAHRFCQRLGDGPQLLPALAGLFRFAFVRADFRTARQLGEQVLRLAERTGDPLIALVAHSLMGALLLSLGELAGAHEHLQAGIRLYDPAQHRPMAALYGDDPGVTCHCFAAMCLWLRGFPDQAVATIERGLAVARALDSPYADTFALDFATWIHVLRRDEGAAQATADALLPIAVAHGFEFLRADADVLRGWALVAQGNAAEGLRRIETGIASYEATGARMSWPAHRWLLARAHAANGQIEAGLAAVADALALVEQTSERTYEAELHRLRGELLLRETPHDSAAAEACFRTALETARRQGARSLELRAATSLARLQGSERDAQQLLNEIYRWFSEGFATADLSEAQEVSKRTSV